MMTLNEYQESIQDNGDNTVMSLNKYQEIARSTAVFPQSMGIIYCALAINGEAGEIAEKVKKIIRDDNGNFMQEEKLRALAHELGDVLWYLANLAHEIGYDLDTVANMNLQKLADRKARGKIKGSGDNR